MDEKIIGRLSDSSKLVLELAKEEADRRHFPRIGTEHLLLGLVRETNGLILARHGFDLANDLPLIRKKVDALIQNASEAITGEPGLTTRADKVLAYAYSEANRFGKSKICPEHIVIGLILEFDGIGGHVLNSLGWTLANVRESVARAYKDPIVSGANNPPPLEPHEAEVLPEQFRADTKPNAEETGGSSMEEKKPTPNNWGLPERATDRARRLMECADKEARQLNHEYIATEHILLGLIMEGSGVGANVLRNLDLDLRKVRIEVLKLTFPGSDPVAMTKLPLTPRVKKIIEYAIVEARDRNHTYVGTEHILLGIICEHDGIAAQVLMNMGIRLEECREEISNVLGMGDGLRQMTSQAQVAPKAVTPYLEDARLAHIMAQYEKITDQVLKFIGPIPVGNEFARLRNIRLLTTALEATRKQVDRIIQELLSHTSSK